MGKTSVQVFEACRAAALGTLWARSPGHTYGVKDSELSANIKTCGQGTGVKINDATEILGYPKADKGDGKRELRYIMVSGWDSGVNDVYLHVYNATGDGSDLGFIAFNEDSWITKIGTFYQKIDPGD